MKHKRIHKYSGRNYGKYAGFVVSHYGPLQKQKTPAGAANTDEGKADTSDQTVSAFHDTTL